MTSESFSLFTSPSSSIQINGVKKEIAFEPIRDGFRIRSCLADLVAFFEKSLPVLVVHLQISRPSPQHNSSNFPDPDDPIIATATVSLRHLARQLALAGDNEDDFAEADITGYYIMLRNQQGYKVPGLDFMDMNGDGHNNENGRVIKGSRTIHLQAAVQLRQTELLPVSVIRVSSAKHRQRHIGETNGILLHKNKKQEHGHQIVEHELLLSEAYTDHCHNIKTPQHEEANDSYASSHLSNSICIRFTRAQDGS